MMFSAHVGPSLPLGRNNAFIQRTCVSAMVLFLVWGTTANGVQAQVPPPSPASAPGTGPSNGASGKAIDERLRAEAERPMRRILEAAATAQRAAAAAAVTVRAIAPPPQNAGANNGAAAGPSRPNAAAAAGGSPAAPSPLVSPPQPVAGQAAQYLAPSTGPQAPPAPPALEGVARSRPPATAAAADALPVGTVPQSARPAAVAIAAPTQPAPAPAAPVPQLPVTPTLVSSVDVEISQAALKRLRKAPEVLVDLTIAPSGRVVDATIREASHPSLVDPVLTSVRQWVFAPLAQTTQHFVRVALSVNAE